MRELGANATQVRGRVRAGTGADGCDTGTERGTETWYETATGPGTTLHTRRVCFLLPGQFLTHIDGKFPINAKIQKPHLQVLHRPIE